MVDPERQSEHSPEEQAVQAACQKAEAIFGITDPAEREAALAECLGGTAVLEAYKEAIGDISYSRTAQSYGSMQFSMALFGIVVATQVK